MYLWQGSKKGSNLLSLTNKNQYIFFSLF